MFVKFSGFNPKGSYLSLEKEKETFCVVFTYSIKRSREIRTFHVAVVQRRLRNEQKKRNARARAKLSPLSFLLNLGPIVVIQKFGYHGNLTSQFSSLNSFVFKKYIYRKRCMSLARSI